ncbi:hypothetical protein SOPP22_08615 [Shewanella sp. OPT22]|nr:hypothetical protein SOPP22_08615 [Shewanella sp. OPT22]
MTYFDSKYKKLFLSNCTEAIRTANWLNRSLVRLETSFPLKMNEVSVDDDDLFDKLDAFRVRFSDLQDCLGHKLFRGLLKLEQENPVSMIDVLNLIEKRRIFSSANDWKNLREIRNSFSHDYPESEKQRFETLNLAWESTPVLLAILDGLLQYSQSIGLEVEQ